MAASFNIFTAGPVQPESPAKGRLLKAVEAESAREALDVFSIGEGFVSYADAEMEDTVRAWPDGSVSACFTNFEIIAVPAPAPEGFDERTLCRTHEAGACPPGCPDAFRPDFVNHEALRALPDEELARSLREDAMPAELHDAMRRERNRRYVAAGLAGDGLPFCSCEVRDDGDGESGPHLSIVEEDPNCPRHNPKPEPRALLRADARVCRFCGEPVQSRDPDTDFCRNCYYHGRFHEERHIELLGRLSSLEGVESASVWHTGGGCFNLAVKLTDGRLIATSVAHRDELTEGEGAGRWWPEAGLPSEPGEKWGVVIAESEEAWSEWDEPKLELPNLAFDEDGLVAFVEALAGPVASRKAPEARSAEELRAEHDELSEGDFRRASLGPALPGSIDAGAIAEEAMQAAFGKIAEKLAEAGYPVTGDIAPDEAFRLDALFLGFVYSLAQNNQAIAYMNEEA